jgi:hypothetical protein
LFLISWIALFDFFVSVTYDSIIAPLATVFGGATKDHSLHGPLCRTVMLALVVQASTLSRQSLP